jgi:hypothetical protein
MNSRQPANTKALTPLLDLIEQRFALRLPTDSIQHLRMVCEHYLASSSDQRSRSVDVAGN